MADKPYAISGANTVSPGKIPSSQYVTYTSFQRPSIIEENHVKAYITYNSSYDRVKMTVYDHGANLLTRHYLGGCYELDETPFSATEKLYLCGDYYDAPVVLVKDETSEGVYQIVRDVIGSITCVIAPDGSSRTMSYDAWGRLRNPDTFEVYERGEEPELFLGRGFTGHEHLTYFGLINMNARLYDPEVGRFLSPDPNVQDPELPQNFNRYTYAMNNPLCYVDKDGEFWWFVAAAAGVYIGGVLSNHGELNPFAWDYKSVSTYFGMATGGLVGVAAVSGCFGFAGALTTPYISAGVAVSAAGAGTAIRLPLEHGSRRWRRNKELFHGPVTCR
ncbi:MAG: RHS repeat-associated core domain-containing protein [Bacteroidales bacterium]|nr:RHS repeat-associated core domain-containing protein [Bacteroidales bacterium]MCM1147140.1 RHS repeat-associated core domain-containing protein [Bacteroidales bacterium]MCM1205366.1 RHS repeat-associated core domain-containing protein [Bacillota bacterium]MCM1509829.1 RHS repeat-associated core domain-containing protein [Clostridium sp.]